MQLKVTLGISFYRLGFEEGLSDYFAVEPVNIAELQNHLSHDEFEKFDGSVRTQETASPCTRVLPMGFSWNL
mgnify:CR=1 FL=1